MLKRNACLMLVVFVSSISVLAEGSSRLEKKIVREARDGFARTMAELERSVNVESASENIEGVRRMAGFYEPLFEEIGFTTRWVPLPGTTGRAGHFVAEHAGTKGSRILFIGHLDTVLEGEPFRRDENTAYGTGIADMKGGNIVIWAALEALAKTGALKDRRVIVIFTGDEESPGDPVSVARSELIELAKRSDIALAYEGAGEETAVVGRRGISTWTLEVDGTTGHSSGIFNERLGSGAVFEAARILDAFHEQLKEENLTFNPSVIVGGTDVEFSAEGNSGSAHGKTNVVAQKVYVKGDLRFLTREQYENATRKMRDIVSQHLPKSGATIEFSGAYPPMAPTEGNRRLLSVYDEVSRDLGYGPVAEYDPGKRGAGDISFVAEYVDGLDGLGAFGAKSHAPGESIEVDKLLMQIERTALLTYRLTR